MWGWGDDSQGELGNNSTSSPGYFEQVSNSSGQWIAAAPGTQFTLALKANGTLWGFGLNTAGQLGNGNTTRQLVPAAISSTKPWTFFSAGTAHAAGIKADGTLWLWGSNDKGQLGNNATTTNPNSTPIQLDLDVGTVDGRERGRAPHDGHQGRRQPVGLGRQHLRPARHGQHDEPAAGATRVGTLNTWQYVSAGPDYTVAVSADGSVYTWGHGSSGQLGDNIGQPQRAGRLPSPSASSPR